MPSSNTNTQSKVQAREPQPIIYSLCIPRVFKNISEKRIRAIFYSLKLGFVERVDMVAKSGKDGKEFWRVFVHFSQWNDRNPTATQFKAKLERGEQVKVVYDQPWFWMISKSYSQPPEQRSQGGRPKAFIDFEVAVTSQPEPSKEVDLELDARRRARELVEGVHAENEAIARNLEKVVSDTSEPPVAHQAAPASPTYQPADRSQWPSLGGNKGAMTPPPARSPSPEPTMPKRENTSAPGDDDYQEELN